MMPIRNYWNVYGNENLLNDTDTTQLSKSSIPIEAKFLNSNSEWLIAYYHKVIVLESNDKKLQAPYEVLHDYRIKPIYNWGNYQLLGEFQIDNQLKSVQKEFIDLFKKNGQLSKGDNQCPRVCNFVQIKSGFTIDIQEAFYYDQVVTNLSLDYPLQNISSNLLQANTLREWDLNQSSTNNGHLPSFATSKLANTIGIAMAIISKNKKGEKLILVRQRNAHVAVSQNLLVLPFSFSLNLDSPSTQGSIYDLIKSDFRHEQSEELGLEPNKISFDKVKPLLFCRELCRGGKPQFFFEIELDILFEDLKLEIKEQSSNKEFIGEVQGFTLEEAKKSIDQFSPELQAYVICKL